ncbi:hypothetical protein, partial [Salmonella enterica]|uniref:hypothetical protein n=1 Tax=Salmonella enterica TaxID=28901 RepID=UPI003FA7034B
MAMGLVALMVMLLLLSDLLFHGFLPDAGEQARRERRLATQLLAGRVVQSLQVRGGSDLGTVLDSALRQEPAMRSAAVVSFDGRRVSTGPHGTLWHLAPDAPSTADNVRSTLTSGDRPWGELQVSFEPVLPDTLLGLLRLPLVQGFILIVTLGFVSFLLYL